MNRPIVGYHQDEHGDWVAELGCGHGQHVRHQPPMTVRPWVLTEAGRAQQLGTMLNCLRCDDEKNKNADLVMRMGQSDTTSGGSPCSVKVVNHGKK
jgi:cytochrome c-type biogenesis protein CcmH/NrfF